MTRTLVAIAAGTAFILAPIAATAAPTPPSPTTAPGNGQYQGQGYSHTNSGNAVGQPGQTCQDLIALGLGATPGNAGSAPGNGSPFEFATTKAGTHYAGSQLQNSRNTASVSQYDVACSNQMP